MEIESDKRKIDCDDLKKCGEITTLLSIGKKEFFLNCGFCDYTFLHLENFISHMCEDHMFNLAGPKIEETHLSLDLNEEVDEEDGHTQSACSDECGDSNSSLRDFERVEIELDSSKMSESLDVKELFLDRYMSDESDESTMDNNLSNTNDFESTEKFVSSDDDADFASSIQALGLAKMFDKNIILRIFSSYEQRPVLWDTDLQVSKYSRKREKEIKNIAEEVGLPTAWDSVRKLIGKLSTRLRTEMIRQKIYASKGKSYTPAWYTDLNTFLKPRRPSGQAKPETEPKPIGKKFTLPESLLTEEQCIILSEIYKDLPSLWDESDITYRFSNRRREAADSIHEEFNKKTGLSLTKYDVAAEIARLRRICTHEKKQKILCKRQNKSYEPICSYYEHLEYLETDVKPYECLICGKLIPGSQQHKIHVASHDGSLPFKCHICEKGFKLLTNLTVHLRRHAQDYLYNCEVCNKPCATTTDLKAHMRCHTGEKPYVCDICGKKYRSLSEFKTHRERHEETPRYKCEVCLKAFYRKAMVKEHMSVHTKVRDKICPICNKGFTTSKHLRQHKQIHADVKKYVCKICGKRFAQYAGLSGHVKSHGTTLVEIGSKSLQLV